MYGHLEQEWENYGFRPNVAQEKEMADQLAVQSLRQVKGKVVPVLNYLSTMP
jgi:hypothetical protein